jgi:hypothetical protein
MSHATKLARCEAPPERVLGDDRRLDELYQVIRVTMAPVIERSGKELDHRYLRRWPQRLGILPELDYLTAP